MSLINDAIKQANKTNKERTPASSAAGSAATTGMQSADARTRPEPGNSMWGMLIIAGIVLFVLLGGTLLFLSLRGHPSPTEPLGPTPLPAVTSAPEVLPSDAPEPRLDPIASALTNPVPAPVAEPAPVAVVVPSEPRTFPDLKLQGIYYRLNDPSVMINGKTLEIGDLIEEARVIRIERKEVTLELDGQQKVLRLQ